MRKAPWVWAVAALVVVVLVIAGEPSDADRVDSLAARLRCPVCQSESVADSASQTARDMRDLIEEQVAGGASNDEVIDFFVGRYGEWIVLDAPASGRTLILWVAPLVAAAVGVVVIVGRRRHPGAGVATAAAVVEDRRDLERQVAMGEIDHATAARLSATYQEEESTSAKAAAGPHRPRLIAGGAVLLIGVAAVTFAVVRATDDREPGQFATGGITNEAPTDLASVTNEELEAVVAANPDIIPMRLALARRYFNDGDFSAALPHYLAILEQEADPEALANVGWMAYLNNRPDAAASYLEESLAVAPDYTQAQWFLANVRLYGLDDPAAAEPLLRQVLSANDVPSEIRQEAEALLEQATSS